MTNPGSSWLMPAVGIGLGVLIGLAELSQGTPPILAASAIVIVGGYAIGIRLLRSRSETASLLLGLPVDERWDSINQRALASAAQFLAAILVGAFVLVEFRGGDAMPYAWLAAAFAIAYLGSILWFRWRS